MTYRLKLLIFKKHLEPEDVAAQPVEVLVHVGGIDAAAIQVGPDIAKIFRSNLEFQHPLARLQWPHGAVPARCSRMRREPARLGGKPSPDVWWSINARFLDRERIRLL